MRSNSKRIGVGRTYWRNTRVPGHRPAVELERRGVEQQTVHVLGPLLREVQRQDAAHRKAAREDDVAVFAQPVVRRLDARIPFLPGRAAQFLGRAAVAGELAAVDGVAGAGETLGDEPKLGRRAAEAVDQQDADAAAANELAAIRDSSLSFLSLSCPLDCSCVLSLVLL